MSKGGRVQGVGSRRGMMGRRCRGKGGRGGKVKRKK